MTNKLEKLIAEYKLSAENHGKAMMEGDSFHANLNYGKLVKLLHQIGQFGNEGDICFPSAEVAQVEVFG